MQPFAALLAHAAQKLIHGRDRQSDDVCVGAVDSLE